MSGIARSFGIHLISTFFYFVLLLSKIYFLLQNIFVFFHIFAFMCPNLSIFSLYDF